MFVTFTRTWYRPNKAWPGGLEPHAGRRHYTGHTYGEESAARAACREWSDSHDPGRLSRKMEYERA